MSSTHLKAVIFDIGGVVVRSPLLAIAAFEIEKGLPKDYINVSLVQRGSGGAWQRFERGELALVPFYVAFGRELSDTKNGNAWYAEYCQRKGLVCPRLPEKLAINGRELFGRMMRESTECDELVVNAIRRIKAAKRWSVVALTNNFAKSEGEIWGEGPDAEVARAAYPSCTVDTEAEFLGWTDGVTPKWLRDLFDDFCDSSTVGLRKPDPKFYLLACERNNLSPGDCVFLDDLGMNLRVARTLGMETIQVPIGGSFAAIRRLGEMLGMDLIGAESGSHSKL